MQSIYRRSEKSYSSKYSLVNREKAISIKICGMRDHGNIMAVASYDPQYLGFIMYTKSPRFVGNEFTIPLTLPSTIKRVGVFVNEFVDVIVEKTKTLHFDFVQLHGDESVDVCAELKDAGINVIKVFSMEDNFDFSTTKPYKNVATYFLFDTKGKLYGGNAKVFNWSILNRYDQEIPFFLSGGLSPDMAHNLGGVLKMNLHALDFNSGVEISPGLKDLKKVQQAILNVGPS